MTTAVLEQPREELAVDAQPEAAEPIATTRPRGPQILFSVSFRSAMSHADSLLLARRLQLVTNLHPKLHNSPASPGVARLGLESGLFLLPEPEEGRWRLEARTWGLPGPAAAREWKILATEAAHALDPGVEPPPRLFAREAATGRLGGGSSPWPAPMVQAMTRQRGERLY